MEQVLTHTLLRYLLDNDFTVLFAAGQRDLEEYIFLPINVDVEDFLETLVLVDYSADKYLIIEEALLLPEEDLSKHRVLIYG